MARRRRQDRTPDLIEGVVKFVIFGVMLVAITVGGVHNFNTVFNSVMSAIIFLVIAALIIGGGIALAVILIRRKRLVGTEQPATDNIAPVPIVRTEPTVSEKLRELDWFQFEKVTAAVMRAGGYAVERRGGAKADGGIDLIARKEDEIIAIQCKHWQAWDVGVKTVREFLGAITHAQIPKGIIVTLKGYTREAEDLAASHNIQLINETQYREFIATSGAQYDPEFQRALNDTTKYCPKCEAPMVLRHGYSQFWGCSRYPQCRYKLKIAV